MQGASMSPEQPLARRSTPKFGANLREQASAYGFYLPDDLLDESQSFGLKQLPEEEVTRRVHIEQCLAGHRIAVVGDSHVQHPFHLLMGSLSYTGLHAMYFLKGDNFSLRVVADTGVFSKVMTDSSASVLIQRRLRNASLTAIEAFRHDVVFVNRGVWDIVRYNTNVSVVGQEFYAAMHELFTKWVKKKGGKIVVMPLYGSVSTSDCLSSQRIELVRLAIFAAVHRFVSENADAVVVTTPEKINDTRVNILIFDMMDYLRVRDPALFAVDGHHLIPTVLRLVVIAWLRSVLGCEQGGKAQPIPAVDEIVESAFLSSLAGKIPKNNLTDFWTVPLEYPKTSDACGCLAADFQAAHPKCDVTDSLLTRQRRHLLVQYLLRHGIQGAADAQVHEMINIVCNEPTVHASGNLQKRLRACRAAIGVLAKVDGDSIEWVARNRTKRKRFPPDTPCICQNATTTVQNVDSELCAAVEAQWATNTSVSCIFMNPAANFDEG